MAQAFVAGATNHIPLLNQLRPMNVVINGGFTVNQRGYVSAAVLASGSYGHDRWKAGASGGDYSFTQLASATQITIAAAKSLIQVIEDKNVHGTQYVLSWEGTAQARYAVNSATPAGSYAASPIVITGQTAGTVMSIEFNTGTLGRVMLEVGVADASNFELRTFDEELRLCQRYYCKSFAYATAPAQNVGAGTCEQMHTATKAAATLQYGPFVAFPSRMRAGGTVTFYNPSVANAQVRDLDASADCSGTAASATNERGFWPVLTGNAATVVGNRLVYNWSAAAEL